MLLLINKFPLTLLCVHFSSVHASQSICSHLKDVTGIMNILFHYFTFSILAFIATITVLNVINTAPAAGFNKTPSLYNTPAANGIATTLYPVAQIRF